MTVRALPVLAVPLIICCLGLGLAAPLAPQKKTPRRLLRVRPGIHYCNFLLRKLRNPSNEPSFKDVLRSIWEFAFWIQRKRARGLPGGPQLDTFRGDYSLLGFNSKMVAPLPGFSRLMHSGPPSPPG